MPTSPCRMFLLCAAFLLTGRICASAAPLLRQDFSGANAWPHLAALPTVGASVQTAQKRVGTLDTAGSAAASEAVMLSARGHAPWTAGLTSGLLPIHAAPTDLGKLTLSFDLSVSSARPVRVLIESFDARQRRTGGREASVAPAAPDFYQRFALDLSAMAPAGSGTFRPTDPSVRLTFKMASRPGEAPQDAPVVLRVDNVCYAAPAFYVSPQGSDTNDGRTERTPFADPQRAVDAAQPGDIVLLMDGTYHRAPTSSIHDGVVAFHRGGTPAAWIVLKNYPGQHPVLTSDAWNTIKIGSGTQDAPSSDPAPAYIEVRGITVRGEADVAKTRYADLIGTDDPRVNGNGILVIGTFMTHIPHHLRFADNLIEFCNASGLTVHDADWVSVENNRIRDNCWTTVYEGAGLGIFAGLDFNPSEHYKVLLRGNEVSGNRCFVKSRYAKKVFNGNGIMIDGNNELPKRSYQGRTLIQNNLAYGNGGVGIQMWGSHRIDLVNNTVYFNGTSPELRWGQVAVTICDDVRFVNNVVVAQPDRPLNTWYGGKENRDTRIVRQHNLYFGGNAAPMPGDADLIADPLFVGASVDAAVADFHLRAGSPAVGSGQPGSDLPLVDRDGRPRPPSILPDRGAYRK